MSGKCKVQPLFSYMSVGAADYFWFTFLLAGTLYGHGVYFAKNWNYSKKFTDKGTLLLALVLVGESTPGNSELRVPPKKPGSDRLYDSLSGPDMVVLFHDTQAYPQYLVTLP